MVGNNIDSALK